MGDQADRIRRLEKALQEIVDWSGSYPYAVFPKPDRKRAHEALTAVGMTLDAVVADALRSVVEGVGNIAREALSMSDDRSQTDDPLLLASEWKSDYLRVLGTTEQLILKYPDLGNGNVGKLLKHHLNKSQDMLWAEVNGGLEEEYQTEVDALQEALGWQPMETAPTDKRVLLYNGYWGAYTAEYNGTDWPTWNSDGGPYYPVPTHWMPMPEPPK